MRYKSIPTALVGLSQISITAFICGTGRLNYNHIIALAHFKLLKSLSASSNRVLKTLCAAHIVSADFINLCSEYGVTLCH